MKLREFLEKLFDVALATSTETFGPPEKVSIENLKRTFSSIYMPAARKELYDRLVVKELASYTPERLISDMLEHIQGTGLFVERFNLSSGSVTASSALGILSSILTTLLCNTALDSPYHGNLLKDIELIQTQLGIHESREAIIGKDEEAKLRHDLANSLLDVRPIIHFLREKHWPGAKTESGGVYL